MHVGFSRIHARMTRRRPILREYKEESHTRKGATGARRNLTRMEKKSRIINIGHRMRSWRKRFMQGPRGSPHALCTSTRTSTCTCTTTGLSTDLDPAPYLIICACTCTQLFSHAWDSTSTRMVEGNVFVPAATSRNLITPRVCPCLVVDVHACGTLFHFA